MTGVGRGGGVKPTRCRVIFNTHRHQQVWEMLPDSSMDLPRSRVSAFRVPVAVDWSIREIPAAIWEGSIVCKTTVITLFKLCHQFRAISKMQRFDKMYLGRSIVAGINPLSTILCSRRSAFAVFSCKDIVWERALRAGIRRITRVIVTLVKHQVHQGGGPGVFGGKVGGPGVWWTWCFFSSRED